jgi:ApaG protein
MSTLITQGVEVKVETMYQPSQSKPALGIYVFVYQITIFNHNPFTVQLLRRRWEITDSNLDYNVVEGEGVVGRQPVLYAGDTHQYMSGCQLKTPIGKMEGIYIFDNKITGEEFTVEIPKFQLVATEILN